MNSLGIQSLTHLLEHCADPYYSSELDNFKLSSTILYCTQDKCLYMLIQEKEGYTTQIKDAICDKKNTVFNITVIILTLQRYTQYLRVNKNIDNT